jgi:hypothetical protein
MDQVACRVFTAAGPVRRNPRSRRSINTAAGTEALFSNTEGTGNTAIGAFTLVSGTTGGDNTAIGDAALLNNTSSDNTAIGGNALFSNTFGFNNHAVRSVQYRYIRYANGDEELYDEKADPYEWTNLATNPELGSVKADLAQWMPKENKPDRRASRVTQ